MALRTTGSRVDCVRGRFATLREAPRIDIEFLPTGDEPNGLGEVPLICVAPAVRSAARALGLADLQALPLGRG
jgi:CO/xanthine dehydrogenase Mo-binding subunit